MNPLIGVVELLNKSPLHQSLTVAEFAAWFLPPIKLGQCVSVAREGRLVGFVTYAFVNDEAHDALRSGSRTLREEEWNSGTHVWVTEFIAPFGHALYIARALKAIAETQGLGGMPVHFVRRYSKRKPDPIPEIHWPRTACRSPYSH